MAKQVIESLIDDLDGSPATSTVTFGLDGQTYAIDLNDKNTAALRATLGVYVEHGRRVRSEGRGVGRSTQRGASKDRNSAIRAWALAEGVELPTRGRIAGVVQDAFDAQDGGALRSGLGLEEVVEEKPTRGRRRRTDLAFSAA